MDLNKIVGLFFLVGFVGSVSAIPELSVDTNLINKTGVNDSVAANRVHTYNLTFTNENESKRIYDVTLSNSSSFKDRMLETDYINFSESRFDLNASESKTVEARVFTRTPTEFNDSLSVPYYYNDTEGNNTGIKFDANKFPSIDFRFETYYVQTSVSKNVLDSSFEMDFGETETSTFDVENEGGEMAYNVSFSGSDMDFEDSGFNISRSDHRLIDFSVKIPKPDENATNKTNQTYTRTVTISGKNFQSKTFDIEVFVPYKEYNKSSEDEQKEFISDLQDLQEFCNQEENEDTPLCGGEVIKYKNRTKVVNNTPVYEANLSESQLDNLANLSDVYLEDINGLRQRINSLKQRETFNRKQLQKNFTDLKEEISKEVQQNEETLQDIKRYRNQTLQAQREETRFVKMLGYGGISIASIISLIFGGLKAYRRLEGDDLEEFMP